MMGKKVFVAELMSFKFRKYNGVPYISIYILKTEHEYKFGVSTSVGKKNSVNSLPPAVENGEQ